MALLIPASVMALGFALPTPVNRGEEVQTWVKTNVDRLPRTLDGISAHPLGLRKLIMAELSLDEQRVVWQAHLESFVRQESELSRNQLEIRSALGQSLNPEQVEFVRGVLARFDEIFDPSISHEERLKRVKVFCNTDSTIVRRDLKAKLIGLVGPAPSEEEVLAAARASEPESKLVQLRQKFASWGLVAPAYTANCTCIGGSGCDCTGIGLHCLAGYMPCSVTQSGCGCFDWFPCEGDCKLQT
jgi:hypothetical protein